MRVFVDGKDLEGAKTVRVEWDDVQIRLPDGKLGKLNAAIDITHSAVLREAEVVDAQGWTDVSAQRGSTIPGLFLDKRIG